MNPASEDIKDMLEAKSSFGLTFAVNLFIGKEPPSPDAVVTLFDIGGGAPMLTFDRNDKLYNPTLNIRIRNNNYLTGWGLANDIKEYLHGKSHEDWNSTRYELIRCIVEPSLMDWDEQNRVRFTVNFEMFRRQ